jgi:hypothetical protein
MLRQGVFCACRNMIVYEWQEIGADRSTQSEERQDCDDDDNQADDVDDTVHNGSFLDDLERTPAAEICSIRRLRMPGVVVGIMKKPVA